MAANLPVFQMPDMVETNRNILSCHQYRCHWTFLFNAALSVVLVLLMIIFNRRRRKQVYLEGADPDDDVRENIIHYDEEGMGESFHFCQGV